MADIEYENLQPEVFTNELTWLEFFEALSEMIEEQVRSPIKELETIRDMLENSDPVIVSNSIKQMGFDIPIDLISHNIERLARSIYMLPLFYETSGTTDFTKAVSFVLGRETVVHDLYTQDYVNFYRQPYGPLQIDGGNWYKATHIGLAMETIPTDIQLILAEDQSIVDRLIMAFYEFAPLNLVIDSFHFLIKMEGTLHINAVCKIMPKQHIIFGSGDCNRRLVLEAPSRVREATSHMLKVGYSVCDYLIRNEQIPQYFTGPIGIDNNTDILKQSITSFVDDSSFQQFTIDIGEGEYGYFVHPSVLGVATFVGASFGSESMIGGWDGAKWPNDGTIGSEYGPLLISRTLGGVTSTWYLYRTDFPSLGKLTFEVRFPYPGTATGGEIANLNFVPIYAVDWYSDKTSLVAFNSDGRADFGLVSKDTPITITASYNGLTAKANIIIEAFNDDIVAIDIVGPDSVVQNNSVAYTPIGVFKDNKREEIDTTITLVSPYAVMDANNYLTVFPLSQDVEVFLMAEYVSRSGARVVAARKINLLYVDQNVHLIGLETMVVAPSPAGAQIANVMSLADDEMLEGQERRIVAIAKFSDNTTREVQPIFISSSPALSIEPNGTAVAKTTDGPVNVSIKATYQHRNIKASSSNVLKILKEDIVIERLQIFGSTTVVELSRSQYSAIANWSDGSVTSVLAEWNCDKFSISDSGVFQAGSTDIPKSVTLTARVDDKYTSFVVVVVNTPIVLKNLNIIGPDNIQEGIVAQFTAYAHYSNDTDIQITPVWTVMSPTNMVIQPNGQFSFAGVPATTLAEIKAEYFVGTEKFVQTKTVVLVPKTSIITSLLISGPDEVNELGRIFLTATAIYEDGSMEVVSPLWTVMPIDPVNEAEAMADIVSPGVLQGRVVNSDKKVLVLARYFKEIAEHVVTIRNRNFNNADVPYSSRIVGPPVLKVNEVGSYAQLIEFENGCGEVMVSSTWTLDVDPEIALIDDDGYLHSVSGAPVPITIAASYSCKNQNVVDTLVVNFISEQASLKELLISGPSSVLANSEQSYFAELFRTGESVFPGNGTILNPIDVSWQLLPNVGITNSIPNGITIDPSGRLFVSANVDDEATVFVQATFREGFETVSNRLLVTATRLFPLYGVGPIGLNTDQHITDNVINALSSNSNGQRIDFTLNSGQYGYFAHLASIGIAKFTSIPDGTEGGWDGASWPSNGTVGPGRGPLTISRTIRGHQTIWYLYRTDFAALGTVSYIVNFV